ncbi:MAG TPA: PAS domain S-box protein, partial [Gemmatimonadaceae bacterium]|nr:PAS domain S-box protein [Gemmatimonadaceae bacterium]
MTLSKVTIPGLSRERIYHAIGVRIFLRNWLTTSRFPYKSGRGLPTKNPPILYGAEQFRIVSSVDLPQAGIQVATKTAAVDTKTRYLVGGTSAPHGLDTDGASRALRVLAVLPDSAGADLIVDELRRDGYDVRMDMAFTRDELLVRARGRVYDIIVADYDLPDWTAADVLATLRELGNDTPVIVMGRVGDLRAIECVRAGAADFVPWQGVSRLPLVVKREIAERGARADRIAADDLIKKLRMAVDQSPASVIFTDTHATIQYVNRRFTEVTGYTSDEAIGRTPRMLSSGKNSRQTYASMWKTIHRGDTWRGEIQNKRKNGEIYWDSVSISPVRDANGVVTHFIASQEDVTERKKAEQKIRDSEERFRQLAENTQEVFFVATASLDRMLYISPAYEQVWGRSCESLYENSQSFIDAVPASDRDRLFSFVARLQRGETADPVEYPVVRPDGSLRWVL